MKKLLTLVLMLALCLALFLGTAMADVTEGQICPDFTPTLLNGGTFTLSDYRGKVVFINEWATWCGPCVGEMPDIEDLQNAHPNDLVVIGLCTESMATSKQFVQQNGYTYRFGVDDTGYANSTFNCGYIPYSIFVDPTGKVSTAHIGSMSYETMETYYQKAKSASASKPVITSQTASVTVAEGKTATFKVEADGATGYQWYYRNSSTDTWKSMGTSGTQATLSFTAKVTHSGHQYRCRVENSAGSVYSNTVKVTVQPKPVITVQPVSVTVNEGKVAAYKLTATGATSYQWYYRNSSTDTWKVISSNGTAPTFSFAAKATHSGHQYRCLVKNSAGSVYSDTVKVTVTPNTTASKPEITVQPVSATVNEGKTVTFKVTAKGATSYQWYYRNSSTDTWKSMGSSGTSTSLSFTAKATHTGHQYRCLVKNSAGSVYSNTVKVTVKPIPVITKQPANASVGVGKTATFKVTANGATSYQWYYRNDASDSWKVISSNGTNATLSFTVKATHSGHQYRCLVKNSAGSVNTKTVTITVPPTVTSPTQNSTLSVVSGKTAIFEVKAGNATSFQWYYRNSSSDTWKTVGSSGIFSSYSFTAKTAHSGHQYRCKVSNSHAAVYSPVFTLKVVVKPTITTQPSNATVNAGEVAKFTVKATSGSTYQWYYSTPSDPTWRKITKSTTATHSVTASLKLYGYKYKCLVKNAAGSVYSNEATLFVK